MDKWAVVTWCGGAIERGCEVHKRGSAEGGLVRWNDPQRVKVQLNTQKMTR